MVESNMRPSSQNGALCQISPMMAASGLAAFAARQPASAGDEALWQGLRLFSPVFLFIGWNVFLSGYFTALGNGFLSALISTLRSLILVVLFILLLPKLIGVNGIWLTMPCAEAVTIFISAYCYRMHGRGYLVS